MINFSRDFLRGVFKTLLNIYDGVFYKYIYRLLVVNQLR